MVSMMVQLASCSCTFLTLNPLTLIMLAEFTSESSRVMPANTKIMMKGLLSG